MSTYRYRTRGGQVVYEAHPFDNWRCTVWMSASMAWCWEARRFGQHSLHVSGESGRLDHSKRIALAAAQALTKSRPR